jgi:hypothetical protein
VRVLHNGFLGLESDGHAGTISKTALIIIALTFFRHGEMIFTCFGSAGILPAVPKASCPRECGQDYRQEAKNPRDSLPGGVPTATRRLREHSALHTNDAKI